MLGQAEVLSSTLADILAQACGLRQVLLAETHLQLVNALMSVVAGLLIFACNPIFKIADDYLPTPVVLFATFGGLRGTVSLILAQMLVTQQDLTQKSGDMLQTAQVRVTWVV